MLKLFKRWIGAPTGPAEVKAPATARPAAQAAARAGPPVSLADPLPEVVAEGNDQSVWNLWEDSMTALDSQMQALLPASRIYVREARPSQLDDIDPFSRLARNR